MVPPFSLEGPQMTSKANPLFLKKEAEARGGEGLAPHCPVNC